MAHTGAFADIYHPDYVRVECDIIRAEWLLGAAYRARGELTREALEIAERCGYWLVQADAHLVLAQLAREVGDLPEARRHAETARQRAFGDLGFEGSNHETVS